MSIEIPSPDDFFKFRHTVVEVQPDRVAVLRQALEPACGWGDFAPLESFLRENAPAAAGTIRWLEDPMAIYDMPSPAHLLGACYRPGAEETGLGGAGQLAACESGRPLLPPPQHPRDPRWLEHNLDAHFDCLCTTAAEQLEVLAPAVEADAWFDQLETWYQEQEIDGATARDLAHRTVRAWEAAVAARIDDYRAEIKAIARRNGELLLWWSEAV